MARLSIPKMEKSVLKSFKNIFLFWGFQLGFVTNKGFIAATNFIVDIASQVHSERYSIKGRILISLNSF